MHVTVSGIEANLGNIWKVLCIADDSAKHARKLRGGQATLVVQGHV